MKRCAQRYNRILERTEPVTMCPFFLPDSQGFTALPNRA
ncbi:hypothetical protein CWATWH8502_2604 [Crocosphaera watsonii WH 8502]|uniref:Uncharacterized protein n=3 Tax=Crocosphaera watsonii TaxID=263511 RepID=T2IFJ4_CROWT|nr:hypothetical protein CWATWH8502_4907 [Crocosphaera watsonii WH 8502]CCQ53572.1 hypothetical protein CWATWH8502_2604 [Crocosphaera watsonii WH 8502]CCQ59449.1 hypothetical protein CWATWH0005_4569 [Crocosphaera watsonii WH 0005]CCQ60610.1 hypothetical protein CWATWH0401_3421 [Crocosphaera watsonii WH 0401]